MNEEKLLSLVAGSDLNEGRLQRAWNRFAEVAAMHANRPRHPVHDQLRRIEQLMASRHFSAKPDVR